MRACAQDPSEGALLNAYLSCLDSPAPVFPAGPAPPAAASKVLLESSANSLGGVAGKPGAPTESSVADDDLQLKLPLGVRQQVYPAGSPTSAIRLAMAHIARPTYASELALGELYRHDYDFQSAQASLEALCGTLDFLRRTLSVLLSVRVFSWRTGLTPRRRMMTAQGAPPWRHDRRARGRSRGRGWHAPLRGGDRAARQELPEGAGGDEPPPGWRGHPADQARAGLGREHGRPHAVLLLAMEAHQGAQGVARPLAGSLSRPL